MIQLTDEEKAIIQRNKDKLQNNQDVLDWIGGLSYSSDDGLELGETGSDNHHIRDFLFETLGDDLFNLITDGWWEKHKEFTFNYSQLTSINLPNITFIPSMTFLECYNLKSVDLPKVKIIGEEAFELCTNLKSIDLPNVDKIGASAFFRCVHLKSIDAPKVRVIEDEVFEDCLDLQSVSFPNLLEIRAGTFLNCESLVSVDAPKVLKLGDDAFTDCTDLESVNLPNIDMDCYDAIGDLLSHHQLRNLCLS